MAAAWHLGFFLALQRAGMLRITTYPSVMPSFWVLFTYAHCSSSGWFVSARALPRHLCFLSVVVSHDGLVLLAAGMWLGGDVVDYPRLPPHLWCGSGRRLQWRTSPSPASTTPTHQLPTLTIPHTAHTPHPAPRASHPKPQATRTYFPASSLIHDQHWLCSGTGQVGTPVRDGRTGRVLTFASWLWLDLS